MNTCTHAGSRRSEDGPPRSPASRRPQAATPLAATPQGARRRMAMPRRRAALRRRPTTGAAILKVSKMANACDPLRLRAHHGDARPAAAPQGRRTARSSRNRTTGQAPRLAAGPEGETASLGVDARRSGCSGKPLFANVSDAKACRNRLQAIALPTPSGVNRTTGGSCRGGWHAGGHGL